MLDQNFSSELITALLTEISWYTDKCINKDMLETFLSGQDSTLRYMLTQKEFNRLLSFFERRSQNDCVHEQVVKVDCECPLYCRKENKNGEKKQYEAIYAGYVFEKPVNHWTSQEEVKHRLTEVDLTKPGTIKQAVCPLYRMEDGLILMPGTAILPLLHAAV